MPKVVVGTVECIYAAERARRYALRKFKVRRRSLAVVQNGTGCGRAALRLPISTAYRSSIAFDLLSKVWRTDPGANAHRQKLGRKNFGSS